MPPEVMAAATLPPKVTDKYVFFFGYEGPEPENTFQQWYPSEFFDESAVSKDLLLKFPTAEHYMMYHKAMLMNDDEVAMKILSCETPAEAKTFGREVRNFDQDKWDAACDDIVEKGNFLKFEQNEDCQKALLGTGSRTIVEASPNDKIWGIGFTAETAEGKESDWGQNRLGKALEKVRKRLGGS